MSFSRYDEDGARTSHHTHYCIGDHCATHCATGDDDLDRLWQKYTLYKVPSKLTSSLGYHPLSLHAKL